MKQAIIFHGTDCTPEDFWYESVGELLKNKGYKVSVPYYPEINHEPVDNVLTKALNDFVYDSETILIGHSSGGPLILSILEKIEAPIAKAILVAGFCSPIGDGEPDPILQESYDWELIKKHSNDFIFINSANDPWGCNDVQGRAMFDKLGGTQIIRNDGHFGSGSFNQPYKDFPLLGSLVLA